MNQQIDALQAELASANAQIASLQNEIQNLRYAVSLRDSTVIALRVREAGLVEELVALQGRVVELERGSR